MAGFMAGVFRNIAGYSTTSITNAIVFFLLESVIIGVVLTYLNRYILTFHPEYQHYVDNQYTGWFLIGFHSIMGCLNIFFYFLASTDAENARTLASSESHHALDVYLTEPTFIYASELNGAARGLCKFGLFLLIIISFMFLGSVGFFIRNVFIYKKMKGVVSKMSQFLLNSTFIQVVLLVTFIFVPFIWATFTWSFTIHNIVNVTNGFVMLISMYGPIDMLCTLYFIVPYRRVYTFSMSSRSQLYRPMRLLFPAGAPCIIKNHPSMKRLMCDLVVLCRGY
uniref:7TM_GPCR_Srx domain-containing protein n=1 Tax=Panagrellus redivivus TaxID=6233 RepID=A0A7E4V0L0_PANRE